MSEQVNLLVDLIRSRINHNNKIIKENEEVVKSILIQPSVISSSEIISNCYSINSKLRVENNDLINIQVELINKIAKFKDVTTLLISKLSELRNQMENERVLSTNYQPKALSKSLADRINTGDQIFVQTIKGELIFESNHPMFNDLDFFERLFDYYKDSENYEMCALLSKLKGRE